MLEASNYSPGLAYRRKPLAVAPKVFTMPTVTESSLVRGSVGMGVFSQNSENMEFFDTTILNCSIFFSMDYTDYKG